MLKEEREKLTDALCSLEVRKECIQIGPEGRIIIRQSLHLEKKLDPVILPIKIYSVYGDVNLSRNELVNTQWFPENIYGRLDCSFNRLTMWDGTTKVCGELLCDHNPDLRGMEHAPFLLRGIKGHAEGTGISSEVREIYVFACRKGCWDAEERWEQNIARLYAAYPSKCRAWRMLDEYFPKHRGAVSGEGLGIL